MPTRRTLLHLSLLSASLTLLLLLTGCGGPTMEERVSGEWFCEKLNITAVVNLTAKNKTLVTTKHSVLGAVASTYDVDIKEVREEDGVVELYVYPVNEIWSLTLAGTDENPSIVITPEKSACGQYVLLKRLK